MIIYMQCWLYIRKKNLFKRYYHQEEDTIGKKTYLHNWTELKTTYLVINQARNVFSVFTSEKENSKYDPQQ